MSLTSNCWSLKDPNFNKRFIKQGPERRTTIVAFKRPQKGRSQVNFGRASLPVDQTGEDLLPLLRSHSARVYMFCYSQG